MPNASLKLIEKAKANLELWQCLIHVTGGELELSKSCLAIMAWKEEKGKEVLCRVADAPGDLQMVSVKYPGKLLTLQRNEVSKGKRILGVRLALDGNDSDEFRYRLN